jgi:hypothetical protein
MPPVFPAHLILVSEGPSLQELETDSGKDIAAAGKVEDVAAANTMEDVAAADTVMDVTVACSVTVNVEDVVADSVKDVVLFERLSEEPLPSELEAGNVKESVALSESTLLMSFNPSRITCFLLSTRASDIPRSPQSVRERLPLRNPVREAPCLGMFVGLSRSLLRVSVLRPAFCFPQTLRTEVGNLVLFIVALQMTWPERAVYANIGAVLCIIMTSLGEEKALCSGPYSISCCITPINSYVSSKLSD